MEIETTTKKWGSSLGIIIPRRVVKEERLQEGQEIRIEIMGRRKTTGADIFGKLKFKKSTQEMLDEVDRDFEPEAFS